jgi:DNA helicase-2/ATP-dependent DNA helicase PcrA
MKYNAEQLEVINCKEGAFAVIAGAGSGKSTVLVERVSELIESGVDNSEIAVVTFTDNSSQDLKSKFKKKKIEGVVIGTFHSICKRILMSEGIDTSKQLVPYKVENECYFDYKSEPYFFQTKRLIYKKTDNTLVGSLQDIEEDFYIMHSKLQLYVS